MAALNFPNNPAINDTYVANNTTWQFNGSSWVRINTGVQGVTGIQGIQGTQGIQGIQGLKGDTGFSGIGIGSTSVNPQSGVISSSSRIGIGFTDVNFVGTGLNITGYGSTVVIDLGNFSKIADVSSLNVSGISTLGFFSDNQVVSQTALLGENTTYYSVHKNIIIDSGSTLTVGSGSTILLDRFNNLDDVIAQSLNSKHITSPFIMSYNRIQENFIVPVNYNAISIGPILSIDSGVVITIEQDANWAIVPA